MKPQQKPDIHHLLRYGIMIIVLFIGGFLLWAFFATLESAAIAPGNVIVAGNRRMVQHLEGGIVKEILVQDGSVVEKSALLIRLENTQAQAVSSINQNELWELTGAMARIKAELTHAETVTFPPAMLKANKLNVTQPIINLQHSLLIANRQNNDRSIAIFTQRKDQLRNEIQGTEAVVEANAAELVFIKKELDDATVLAEKRLIKQSRYYALRREFANVSGKTGELKAKIAELKQKIGETDLQILAFNDKRRKDLLDELNETNKKLYEIEQRSKASEDILARTEIRAPIAGTVVNLKVHTIGGVIRAGEEILDIVPDHEALIIAAKLNPLDIDAVHNGLPTKVVLTGLSQRNTPQLHGKVIFVSADALTDTATNKTYFLIKVQINPKEIKKLAHVRLYPGMPAEVMVITQKNTPWHYFTQPIMSSFDHAFREN